MDNITELDIRDQLSEREVAILRLMAEGLSSGTSVRSTTSSTHTPAPRLSPAPINSSWLATATPAVLLK
jgi:hypothetical protein